jgi:hypothetical protein
MQILVLIIALSMPLCAWAQDEEITETVTASSCSLFVKTQVRPVFITEQYGQVQVDATLCDKDGVPISDREINLTSTTGTLACLPSDSVLAPGDSLKGPCFVTSGNGTITMFLIHVPFNKPGRVTATCSYRGFTLKSMSSYVITRKTVKTVKKK